MLHLCQHLGAAGHRGVPRRGARGDRRPDRLPHCVNEAVGLASTQCLVDLFDAYGFAPHQEWVDWNRALDLCRETTGVLNSTRWYHFVGVRGLYGSNTLWVANSAPGYQGIWDQVGYGQFQQWAGSWQMVWLEH